MCTLAGTTAIRVAISDHPAGRRAAFDMSPTPPAISATPLTLTSALGAGRRGRRDARGRERACDPATRGGDPSGPPLSPLHVAVSYVGGLTAQISERGS